MASSAYQCYHESDSYSELQIESSGEDFFAALTDNVPDVVYHEDLAYVRQMLRRDAVLRGLEQNKNYELVYRLMLDGKPVYHKIRATLDLTRQSPHILLGIRNVDETIRQEKAHTQALSALYQKERAHLEAILASAAGYLEANLTKDRIMDLSPQLYINSDQLISDPTLTGDVPSYDGFIRLILQNQVVENAEKFAEISSREYLLACFRGGEKRASVSYSSRWKEGRILPCRSVFYLYQDNASGDVFVFAVIYDLTEQQRREKERQELETALQMSRIRNFTSQMQPHFLYNALGSIQEVVLEDPAYASELIGDFTTHLRSCIRAMSNDAPLPFSQELANIRAYVNIEKMRFGEKLRVVYDVPVTGFRILPLSIQPLVENAIRHGIYQRGAAGGTVTLRSREQPDSWIVEVEDDGVGFDVEAFAAERASGKRDSTGLENVRFRLEKVMHAGVALHSVVGQGTKVVVTIPKGGWIE